MTRPSSLISPDFAIVLVAIVSLGALAGCGRQTPSDEQRAASTRPEASPLPALADLDAGWNRVRTGGDTVCSDGSDYSFFARQGDPSKLLVYFQGGGGCWTGETCSRDRYGSFNPVVGDTDPAELSGIFALGNAENPFADFSMVFVPYCTGDVHLGDNDVTYAVAAVPEGTELEEGKDPGAHSVTIRHRGHTNAMAVLGWTFEQFQDPKTIFVTGSSAGSIPSPYYGAHVAERYPAAQLTVLGDGAGGYRRFDGVQPFEPWDTLDAIDAHESFAVLQPEDFTYESLYVVAARQRPDLIFAQYDTAEDVVQKRFLALGGSSVESLLPLLDANHADIESEVPNFRSYVAGGDVHTILARPELYTYQTDGVRLLDWVSGLVSGEPVDSVHCSASCDEPGLIPSATAASTGGG